ncbi:hypothetical protein HDC92_001794 [Pedobacter sp. AK017]|nr:hypothetical protein [Pedobacter sp. AK017]
MKLYILRELEFKQLTINNITINEYLQDQIINQKYYTNIEH